MRELYFQGKNLDAVAWSMRGEPVGGVLQATGQMEANGWCCKPLGADVIAVTGAARVILLSDCAAGARAELETGGADFGMFARLDTEFGAALWLPEDKASGEEIARVKSDNPGHEFLRYGGRCSLGHAPGGCIEAFVSGAGIKRTYDIAAENIPHEDLLWEVIKNDLAIGMNLILHRYELEYGAVPKRISFVGAVALGGPDMLPDLHRDLKKLRRDVPNIAEATHCEDSSLHGIRLAALDALCSS